MALVTRHSNRHMKALFLWAGAFLLITACMRSGGDVHKRPRLMLVGATTSVEGILPPPDFLPKKRTFNITVFTQYVASATSDSQPTVKFIFGPPLNSAGSQFASVAVQDNKLTQTAAYNSTELGRQRGILAVDALNGGSVLLAFTLEFTAGRFSGSSLAVFGQAALGPPSLLSIVGGTNALQDARGFVGFEIIQFAGTNGVVRLTAVVERP